MQSTYEQQLKLKEYYSKSGLYQESDEHSSCGVGMVVNCKGIPSRNIVELSLEALSGLTHRGATAADGRTGDGAGIQLQIPQKAFRKFASKIGHNLIDSETIAVGMIFLPRIDEQKQEICRSIVEEEILNIKKYGIYGWRHVPINPDAVGSISNTIRPTIEQILIKVPQNISSSHLEKDLFLIRRRIENQIIKIGINDFYICSLSSQTIVYKGMLMATELQSFYPDLQDKDFISSFAIYHQRYSTNTFPNWQLAQPFRCIAHNGEINTLSGNINWIDIQESSMANEYFGDNIKDLFPFIQPNSSDTAALDAIFEALVKTSYDAPHAQATLIPKAYEQDNLLNLKHKALFEYNHLTSIPWDGPVSLCGSDGNWVIASVDRNGLRPLRAYLRNDDVLFVGSETGLVDIKEQQISKKFALRSGGIIGVNLNEGKFYPEEEMIEFLSSQQNYEKLVSKNIKFENIPRAEETKNITSNEIIIKQKQFAITKDHINDILNVMATTQNEPLGSQGDDSPISVLSKEYRGLHHFFRQSFSQVTNPPIDPIREKSVMSLKTRLGFMGNFLASNDVLKNPLVVKPSPVMCDIDFETIKDYFKETTTIDALWNKNTSNLSERIDEICKIISEKVRCGISNIIITDRNSDKDHIAIPIILLVGAIHTTLKKDKLRNKASIHVESSELIDSHYLAVLIGVGASTVYPWLAIASIKDSYDKKIIPNENITKRQAVNNYVKALENGLLKIMSKLGISIVSSYRGGCPFDILGLSRSLVNKYFPAMRSPISGIGIRGLEILSLRQHSIAYKNIENPKLILGSHFNARAGAENRNLHSPHAFNAKRITLLQEAVTKNDYDKYKQYTQELYNKSPINLRDVLYFSSDKESIARNKVESIHKIRQRFVGQAMSHGALSKEAHETLAIAMNRIGAKSCSGEGGESIERTIPYPNGDNANSKIKQVASGRFGVTCEYLNTAEEIEIKVAQGAKPGEGGQLPGFKVTAEIAKLRHSTEGVTLISPPPHHDIYSIEDLAQLIYDLKQVNPKATVCVKLTSRLGIGTIASGVAKAGADTIVISGGDGGTGASPQTSILYAGMPWELGLASVNQVLTMNSLRHKVKLRVDGGIRSGRDVVVGAMLGAEEFGLGTIALIAMGCQMLKQCHTNTCPFGICTQKKQLREYFKGKAEHVVNLITFMSQEIEEILGSLGYPSIDEIVGRADLLTQFNHGSDLLDNLDLNPLIATADSWKLPRIFSVEGRNELPNTLDSDIIKDIKTILKNNSNIQLALKVKNTHRSVGARVSSYIVRKVGVNFLREDQITLRLDGSAGQSLGAFAIKGLRIEVYGDANDYVGKGLSGATIIIRQPQNSKLTSYKNTIIGNTALYGATSGKVMINGVAGERFCVRNSGALVVSEGCGNNGCEYMTGGNVIILGSIGANFAAGMSGGIAFIYDNNNIVDARTNKNSVIIHKVEIPHYQNILKQHLQDYVTQTNSNLGNEILNNWETSLHLFKQISPKEMLDKFEVFPLKK